MTKKLIVIFLNLLLSIILVSCNHPQEVSGVVIDSETKVPIDSVYIYRYGKMWNNTYSDTIGYFRIGDVWGFPFGYKSLRLIFEKNGYERKTVKFDNHGYLKITLEKKE